MFVVRLNHEVSSMNKLFKIVTIYIIGIVCVFTLIWRVNTIDEHSNKIVCAEDTKVVCNN